MSATIVVIKTTGAAGYETETEVSSLPGGKVNLKSVDDPTTAASSAPITIPTSGTEYSYESWIRFKCTVGPDNQCTNFQIWDDAVALDTGVDITVNTDAVNTYATPVVTQSTKGTRASISDHGSGSKISISGTLTGVGDKTDFSVFQLEVISTASPGNMTEKTINYSYDET
ncbi:MAG: hypothetical protein ACFFAU_01400 [Candidatus Hodarchaeota archaeon]